MLSANLMLLTRSHIVAFLFGLSVSLVLTMCSDSDAKDETESLEDVEARVAALEALAAQTTVTQRQGINTFAFAATDLSNEIRWDIATIQAASEGSALLEIADDAGNTRTTFTALRDCEIHAHIIWNSSAGGNTADIRVNGTTMSTGHSDGDASATLIGGGHLQLSAGDVVTFFATATADFYVVLVTASAEVPVSEL